MPPRRGDQMAADDVFDDRHARLFIVTPRGAAIVFSCSLLHAVSRVTAGARYAFLPFLYDDAAAEIRRWNASTLDTRDAISP